MSGQAELPGLRDDHAGADALPAHRTGRPGPGLLAHVAVAKFADHIPLHRQAMMYAREGVELDRTSLADWVAQAVFLLAPLAESIARHVLSVNGAE